MEINPMSVFSYFFLAFLDAPLHAAWGVQKHLQSPGETSKVKKSTDL
jgi:hypothetical protein